MARRRRGLARDGESHRLAPIRDGGANGSGAPSSGSRRATESPRSSATYSPPVMSASPLALVVSTRPSETLISSVWSSLTPKLARVFARSRLLASGVRCRVVCNGDDAVLLDGERRAVGEGDARARPSALAWSVSPGWSRTCPVTGSTCRVPARSTLTSPSTATIKAAAGPDSPARRPKGLP